MKQKKINNRRKKTILGTLKAVIRKEVGSNSL